MSTALEEQGCSKVNTVRELVENIRKTRGVQLLAGFGWSTAEKLVDYTWEKGEVQQVNLLSTAGKRLDYSHDILNTDVQKAIF